MTSRREFLRRSASAAAAASIGLTIPQFLAACREASERHATASPFTTLSETEAGDLEAVASCIVPTTDTPGAREAGVIHFFDNVLGGMRADMLDDVRSGLSQLNERVRKAHPEMSAAGVEISFAAIDVTSQIALLTETEEADPHFFESVRLLTMAGLFAHPNLGGNRDKIGWDLIGFEDRHVWQPPFGYYDEEWIENAGGDHAEHA